MIAVTITKTDTMAGSADDGHACVIVVAIGLVTSLTTVAELTSELSSPIDSKSRILELALAFSAVAS